ncbi:MAG TPA: hypothetical protein VJI32_03385 [Candidatus Nanoarchaeia archaeon]|nr:hypothetical protein [Candidatus Nanoarchaeia archaeon]
MDLPRERQEYIDSVVEGLQEKYGVSPDWQRLAEDESIQYVVDNRFVVPISGEYKAGLIFIGVPENAGTPWGEWSRAHEFGHTLLGHFSSLFIEDSPLTEEIYEEEADYFAQKFTGKKLDLASYFSQTIVNFSMHPLISLVAAFLPRQAYNNHVETVLGLHL